MSAPRRPVPLHALVALRQERDGFDAVKLRDDLIGQGLAAVEALASDVGSTWVEVIRSGTIYGNATWGEYLRTVTFTEDDIRGLAETYAAVVLAEGWFGGGAPVGCNHALYSGALDAESTQAFARIRSVEARDNDDGGVSLWGEFVWTSAGAELVNEGKFSAISAEILHADVATSKLTGQLIGKPVLVGATLCNDPMIPGMAPPTAPDSAEDETLIAASGRAPSAPAAAVPLPNPAKDSTMQLSEIAAMLGCPEATIAETLRGRVAEVETLRGEVTTLRAEVETLTGDRDKLTEQVEALTAEAEDRIVLSAIEQGRIAPAERETFLLVFRGAGQEAVDRTFPEGRTGVGVRKGHSKTEGDQVESLSAAAERIAKSRGRSEPTDADRLRAARERAAQALADHAAT